MSGRDEWVQKRLWMIKSPPDSAEELTKSIKEIIIECRRRDGTRQKAIGQDVVEALIEQVQKSDEEGCNKECRSKKFELLLCLCEDLGGRERIFAKDDAGEACVTLLNACERCETQKDLLALLALIEHLAKDDPRTVGFTTKLSELLCDARTTIAFGAARALAGASRFKRHYEAKVIKDLVALFRQGGTYEDHLKPVVKILLNIATDEPQKDVVLETGVLEDLAQFVNKHAMGIKKELCCLTVELVRSLATCMKAKKDGRKSIQAALTQLLLDCQPKQKSFKAPPHTLVAIKDSLMLFGENPKKLLVIGKQIMDKYPAVVAEVFGEKKAAQVACPYVNIRAEQIVRTQAIALLKVLSTSDKGVQAIWNLRNIVPRCVEMIMNKFIGTDGPILVSVLTEVCKQYLQARIQLRDLAGKSSDLTRVLKKTDLVLIFNEPKVE